jgi:hypothetical protein
MIEVVGHRAAAFAGFIRLDQKLVDVIVESRTVVLEIVAASLSVTSDDVETKMAVNTQEVVLYSYVVKAGHMSSRAVRVRNRLGLKE